MLSARQEEFIKRVERVRERGFQVGDEAVAVDDGVLSGTPPCRHNSGRWYVLVQIINSPGPGDTDWFIVCEPRCNYGLKCWVPSPDDLHRAGKTANIKRIRCISRTEKAATCEVLDEPVMSAEGDEEPVNTYDPDEDHRVVGDDDDTNRPYLLGEEQ